MSQGVGGHVVAERSMVSNSFDMPLLRNTVYTVVGPWACERERKLNPAQSPGVLEAYVPALLGRAQDA